MKRRKWILLVEDNANDVDLALRAMRGSETGHEVVVVRDGADALDCLYRRNEFAGRTIDDPVVVVLDLKMPKVDGLDVLQTIKQDAALRLIPVVIFTSSCEEADVVRCYQCGANAYVVKPVNFKRYVSVVQEVGTFWGGLNELPHTPLPALARVPAEPLPVRVGSPATAK